MLVYVCVCTKRSTRRSHVFSTTHFSFTSDISPAFISFKILLRTTFAPHRSSGISFNYVVSTIHIQYVWIFTILDLVSRVPFKLNGIECGRTSAISSWEIHGNRRNTGTKGKVRQRLSLSANDLLLNWNIKTDTINKTQYFEIIITFRNTFLGILGNIFSSVKSQVRNILSVRKFG